MKSNTFNQRIYQITALIPKGKVATYGQIAMLAGNPRASRIVGAVMAQTPAALRIPCHRVIYRDGTLCRGEAFGIKGWQKKMLKEEGVFFTRDGKVDLHASLWHPDNNELFEIEKFQNT